ncbi:MAG: putative ATPase [Chthonomonadaceae bacterium]|nr:putative ATPase [Chthonomonadaceae bacterium]
MIPNAFRKNLENLPTHRGFRSNMPNSLAGCTQASVGRTKHTLGGFLRVELLGGIRVRIGEDREVMLRSRKALHLLAYLALHPGQAVSRERLLDLFWPELDESAGRDNLSTTLGLLRRALAPCEREGVSPLQADRPTVSLLKDVLTTDVEEFETTLRQVQRVEAPSERRILLEKALSLYTGGPLPGLYADWAVEMQDRLAGRYLDALRSLLQLLLHTEDFEAALAVAARAIAADPYDEIGYRAKMRACAALERTAAARETYQALTQRLQDDLQAAPSHATRELAERIQRQPESFLPTTAETPTPPPTPAKPSQSEATVPFAFAMPPHRTRFFGREPELLTLRSLLDPEAGSARLVTLTGPGGVGKTRLVLELAHQMQAVFAGGVCFLSLADITDPTLLPSLVAHALRIGSGAGIDVFARIAETLQGRRLLLILDNYEQLVEEGSLFVRSLLDQVATLQIVVTSRLRLELEGEREFPLSPLPTPGEQPTLDALAACASVRLFIDRARQRNPDFALTEGNRAAIGSLCAKLEGIPLALELAAGWTGMLLPEQMLARMEERFDLLVSRRRDIAPRHRTLRAAMEGSYRLLTPDLQRLFCELSVFRGGFTLETLQEFRAFQPEAEAALPATSLLASLADLQAHSLIRVEERPTGQTLQIRYRLLETVREFGWRQRSAEERHVLQDRHALCFQQRMRRLSAQAERIREGIRDDLRRSLDEIESDMDNLRAALRWLLFDGDAVIGAQMAVDLDWFWMVRNFHAERREWSKIAFDRTRNVELPENLRDGIGINRMHHAPRAETLAWYEERVAALRMQGRKRRLAHMLILYGDHSNEEGVKTACMEESLALFTELGDSEHANLARAYLAGAFTLFGHYHRSLPLLEICLRYNREAGKEWDVAQILFAQGVIAFAQGDAAPAQERLREALAFYQRVEFLHQESSARCWLAAICATQGQFDEAVSLLADGLRQFEEKGRLPPSWSSADMCGHALIRVGRLGLAERVLESALRPGEDEYNILRELTRLALAQNDLDRARQRHAEWREHLTQIDSPISRADYRMLGAILAWKQGDSRAAWGEMAHFLPTLQRTGRWPLLLAFLPTAAALALAENHPEEAAQLLGSWEGLHARMALVPLPYEYADAAAVGDRLPDTLLPADLAACKAEGSQWTAQHASSVILRLIPTQLESDSPRLHLA